MRRPRYDVRTHGPLLGLSSKRTSKSCLLKTPKGVSHVEGFEKRLFGS